MKLSIALALMLAAGLHAETVNLVNLVSRDSTQFTLSQGGNQETFQLSAGTSSGKFKLSEDSTIICREVPAEELKLSPTGEPKIAILHETGGTPQWRVVPSVPSEGKLSLRILNLAAEPVRLGINGEETEITPDVILSLPDLKGRRVALSLKDPDFKKNFEPADPSAGLALIFKQDEEWRIAVIPDI